MDPALINKTMGSSILLVPITIPIMVMAIKLIIHLKIKSLIPKSNIPRYTKLSRVVARMEEILELGTNSIKITPIKAIPIKTIPIKEMCQNQKICLGIFYKEVGLTI